MIFVQCEDKNTILEIASGDTTKPIDQRFEDEFGMSHTMVGSYLLHWWQMPLSIYECARHYTTPSEASQTNGYYITLIHIASYYAWRAINIEFLNHNLDMAAINYHAIDIDIFESCMAEL